MPSYHLYHRDCREILDQLPPNGVAIVTDPPYGIRYNPGYGKRRGAYPMNAQRQPRIIGDDKPFDPAHLLRFETVVLFGAENFANRLPPSRCWFIWDKRCNVIPPRDQGDCELAWCSRRGVPRVFYHIWDGMIRASERNTPRVHPTQKPIALFKWIIAQLNLPRDTLIVDPYAGSGTCGVAAAELGYSFWGCEIDEHYYQIAQARIGAAYAQMTMPNEQMTSEQKGR